MSMVRTVEDIQDSDKLVRKFLKFLWLTQANFDKAAELVKERKYCLIG